MQINAYAKINLFLDIESRRMDGFHDILSVMQTVSLADTVYLEVIERGIELENDIGIEKERDLAYRAAKAFFAESGVMGGICIKIDKKIPMGAGLAGGSADAAAVLRGLNELYGKPFCTDKLAAIGLTLGSDVPFCVIGGTKLARGRGELLTDMPPMPDCAIVIAIGDDHVSTPAQFAELDRRFDNFVGYEVKNGRIGEIEKAFLKGDFNVSDQLFNIFELTGRFSPEIKEIMKRNNALGALMSGSGSSVFGIFENNRGADAAAEDLINKGYRAFVCRPVAAI